MNAQDKFKILHDSPLLRSDPVLGKIAIVGEREEVIYGLPCRFVNNERIDHGRKAYRAHFAKSVEHMVHRVPSSDHVSQELLGLDCNGTLLWRLTNYKPSSCITILDQ